VPNLFVYDRNSGDTTLMTASVYGGGSGANRSFQPLFSPDGQTLVFQSAAFDLVTNDATYLSAIPCSPIDPDMVWLAQHTPQLP